MRDVRRGERQESEHVVTECQAMAKEVSWSGSDQVGKQVREIHPGDWKKQALKVTSGRFANILRRTKLSWRKCPLICG